MIETSSMALMVILLKYEYRRIYKLAGFYTGSYDVAHAAGCCARMQNELTKDT